MDAKTGRDSCDYFNEGKIVHLSASPHLLRQELLMQLFVMPSRLQEVEIRMSTGQAVF